MATRIPPRWRAADGSEHASKIDVEKYEARLELGSLFGDTPEVRTGDEIATYLVANADAVISLLKLHATPVKRPRKAAVEAVDAVQDVPFVANVYQAAGPHAVTDEAREIVTEDGTVIKSNTGKKNKAA